MVGYYFIGCSARSNRYKFYNIMNKFIFEFINTMFFGDVEFTGKNTLRNFIFEEDYIDIFIGVIEFF